MHLSLRTQLNSINKTDRFYAVSDKYCKSNDKIIGRHHSQTIHVNFIFKKFFLDFFLCFTVVVVVVIIIII